MFQASEFAKRPQNVCYAGGISKIRGEEIMVNAIKNLKGYKLLLAGTCEDETIKKSLPQNVTYLGMLNRDGINELYSNSRVGICILLPIENYTHALPIKLFEYMAAGLPVIASNFPLWEEIIRESNCGNVVDPLDTKAIRKSIEYYIENPKEAQIMGENGRKTVIEKYNWANEGKLLVDFYALLFNQFNLIETYS